MKVQILNLPSLGDPKFAVIFSEVSDAEVATTFTSKTRSMAEALGAQAVLVFRDSIEVAPDV